MPECLRSSGRLARRSEDRSTAVASDWSHFGAFDKNIFTEWHSRYGGLGVLIYWHDLLTATHVGTPVAVHAPAAATRFEVNVGEGARMRLAVRLQVAAHANRHSLSKKPTAGLVRTVS
jgi:hypothetical protein